MLFDQRGWDFPARTASRAVLARVLIEQGPAVLKHRVDGTDVEALAFAMTRAQSSVAGGLLIRPCAHVQPRTGAVGGVG